MLVRDRPWVNAYVTTVCGPFAMPSLSAFRDAVTALADRYPHSRLTWGFGEAENTWCTGRPVESIVIERDWDDPPNYTRLLDANARDGSLEPPLTLIRYPNYFGMKMSHSLGDGPVFMSVVAAVLFSAINGEIIPWPPEPAGPMPSLRAALRTFAGKPSRVRATLRDRHRATATSDSATRPWQPSRHTIYTRLSVAATDEIYAWGKRFAPDANRLALQASLLLRALNRVGITISDDVRLMFDLRGYLGTKLIDSNFLAGVPVAIDHEMAPEQIAQTIRATRESGRPLANQLATSLRVRAALPVADHVPVGVLPQVTFSYLGTSPPPIEWLPYASEPHVYAASVEPGGPQGVTFLHGTQDGEMGVNTTFHDNVVDSVKVHEALGLICSDPVALLSEARGAR
jgi:hypothetical protein